MRWSVRFVITRRVFVAALTAVAILAVGVTFSPSAFADARTEAVAKKAIKKAQADFAALNYGTGSTRLQKALRACGESKCTPQTKATLLMDLGAMQFKKGAKDESSLSFQTAAKLVPGIAFDPAFDSPELRAAFAAATGAGGGDSGGVAPTGDFGHTPAAEQAANTPLPIYVDGGPDSVARVVVKYRSESMSSWKRIDLKKLDSGWGGLIPCADVKTGTLRYYIQGIDDTKTPVGSNGDAKHPYTVQIKDSISGAAPHLPGKAPPKSCSESSDCPPDFPGCSKSGESAGDSGDENGDEEKEESKPSGPFKRFWVGVGAELEFISVPSGNDVCALDPTSALPSNSNNLYCTTQSGADFPSRASSAQNNALCTAAQAQAGLCPGDAGGHSGGGLVPGDMRLMLAFDYAVTANLLVGARLGLTLFPYPGNAAVSDGRAFGTRFYGEARGTWVFGENALGSPGIKPMVQLGAGAAQFDGHVSGGVAYCTATQTNPAGPPSKAFPPGPCQAQFATGSVNIWETSGPAFGALGGGVRWNASDRIALTGALRLNLSFGASGLVPTYGPEITAQYGF
jgi:hypothetical protein